MNIQLLTSLKIIFLPIVSTVVFSVLQQYKDQATENHISCFLSFILLFHYSEAKDMSVAKTWAVYVRFLVSLFYTNIFQVDDQRLL